MRSYRSSNPRPNSGGRGRGIGKFAKGISQKINNMESKMQHNIHNMRSNNSSGRQHYHQQQRRRSNSNSTSEGQRKDQLMNNYDAHYLSSSTQQPQQQQPQQQHRQSSSSDSVSTSTDVIPPSSGHGGVGGGHGSGGGGGISRMKNIMARQISSRRHSSHNDNDNDQDTYMNRNDFFNESNNNTKHRQENYQDEDDDGGYDGGGHFSQFNRRKRSSSSSSWIVPPHLRLASRIDTWFIFALSSCAAVSSIGAIHSSTAGSSSFTSSDKFALTTCALSFIFGLGMAIGLRYGPLRYVMTKNIYRDPTATIRSSYYSSNRRMMSTQGQVLLHSLKITGELLVLTFLLIFWIAAMPIIVNGNAYYNSNRDGAGLPLAMAGTDIWNANIFYSSWISALLCGYLWIDVYTLTDRRGTLKIYDPSTSSSSNNSTSSNSCNGDSTPNNTFTKRWTLLAATAIILMSASIRTYNSPSCSGNLLRQTNYCSRALFGILIGGFLQLLIICSVGGLYRLSHMTRRRVRGRQPILSKEKRITGASICAVITLIVQAVNAGLLTSPTGGGPGNISGSIYFGCWLGLILSFELCLRYLEFYSTSNLSAGSVGGGSRGQQQLFEDVTVYEDEDEEDEESHLKLQNAPSNQPRIMHNRVVVEDVSDDEDGESFLFLPAPDITQNKHFGGGQDPDETTSAAEYIAKAEIAAQERQYEQDRLRGSSSPSSGPRVGSIDARSIADSKSPDELADEGSYTAERRRSKMTSSSYESDLNSALFDEQFEKNIPQDDIAPPSRTNNPMKMLSKSIILGGYQMDMDQVEELDNERPMTPASKSKASAPSGPSDLSPLEEGTHETSPTNARSKSSSQVGDNLKAMMNGGIAAPPSFSRKSKSRSPSTRSGSRGRSREGMKNQSNAPPIIIPPPQNAYFPESNQQADLGLSNLPTPAGMGGMEGAQLTVKSKQTAVSHLSIPSMSTQSRSLYTDKTSRGPSSAASRDASSAASRSEVSGSRMSATRSASTVSSRSSNGPSTASGSGGSLCTDDGSGSNPPETVSSHSQSGSGLPSTKSNSMSSKSKSNRSGNKPPPPPFRRSNNPQPEFDAASQFTESAPVRAIHADTASIVSDPTLDPGLVDPGPIPVPSKMPSKRRSESVSTNSSDKKYSDETDLNHSPGSGKSPVSSQEGEGSKIVDNIVAAALAFAEKAHDTDSHGLKVRSSGTTNTSRMLSQRSKPDAALRASAVTQGSSIHSFFSGVLSGEGEPDEAVDDLVAKALSQAQGQIDNDKKQKQQQQQQQQHQQPKLGKSMHSMYSADGTEDEGTEDGSEFDC